jgi:hypothetical protein
VKFFLRILRGVIYRATVWRICGRGGNKQQY